MVRSASPGIESLQGNFFGGVTTTPVTYTLESEKTTTDEESNRIADYGFDDDVVVKKSATITNDNNNAASTVAVFTEWANSASINGLAYAADYEHSRPWKRIIWVCLVLVCTSTLIWQVEVLISDYLQYKVNTVVETISPASLDFPDVTVCNAGGHLNQSLEEFIGSPTFNGKNMNVSDHWKFILIYDGYCVQFSTAEKVSRPGIEGGLEFYAKIDPTLYHPKAFSAGLKVFVTQPGAEVVNQVPFVFASPGVYQFIALERQDIRRERTEPWSKCNGTDSPAYTQPHCRAVCSWEQVRKLCNCREYGDDKDDLDHCQNFPECYAKVDGEAGADNLAKCEEGCIKPPCSEDVFSTRSSTQSLYSPNETEQEEKKKFAYVHVNYQAIRKEMLTESKETTFSVLLANIGGQMGLFVGISAISIIEIFGELMIFRLLPRFWGDRRLYGVGSTEHLN